MIILFAREMKHGDRKIKKVLLLGTLTSSSLSVTDIFYFNHKQKTLCTSLITIIYPITVECLQSDGRSDRKGCFGILNSRLACPGSPRLQEANLNGVKVIGVSASLPLPLRVQLWRVLEHFPPLFSKPIQVRLLVSCFQQLIQLICWNMKPRFSIMQ